MPSHERCTDDDCPCFDAGLRSVAADVDDAMVEIDEAVRRIRSAAQPLIERSTTDEA